MSEAEILREAIGRRIARFKTAILLNIAFAAIAVSGGIALFVYLWFEYRTDETEAIAQLFSTSTTLVSAGVGGFLLREALGLHQKVGEGTEWLDLHGDAKGPPPHELLPIIEGRIVDWLGG